MAEIVNDMAVKVLEQLGSRIFQELSSALGVGSELKKLKRTVLIIKAVLLDAEEKQASIHSLRIWLMDLKDILKDAENLLDEFQCRALQKEVMKRYGSTSKKVCYFFSGSNPLVFRFEMAHKIKGIRERVDELAALIPFVTTPGFEDRKITMHRRDMTHSFVNPSDVIGRDDDKKKIIHLLMQQDAGRNVSVIPIIGIGGLGKTTIANMVYSDKGVVSHFQLRMWVCVSEDFDVTRLIKEILKSAIGKTNENLDVDGLQISLRELFKGKKLLENLGVEELQSNLRELLKEKKFLLVLDDVWNEDHNKWIKLEALFRGGCNGSKIILTTRYDSVANITGTAPTYKLGGLSQEECLSLFVQLAFKEGEEKQHPNLFKIGKEIVKKCKGVPLAVRTLAGLLYSKVDEKEWERVRDNEIWNLEQKEGGILPTLKLSYDQLPFQLKQCFAYCSLFPKDHQFNNLHLIQFWMAHGILQSPVNENQELEDIGDLYIKELMSRSFFQDFDEKELPTMYSFKMHDLVHDLALSIAKEECSVVTKQSSVAAKVCHLSILDNGQEVTTQLENLSKVRTIIFQTEQPVSFVEACISRFKYLRMLFKEILEGNDKIKQLPNSICKLYNLQTLWLAHCQNLERLPKGIRNTISLRSLNSLRFLWIADCKHLKCLFEGMDGRLPYLRTLVVRDCPSLTSLSLSIKHLTALEVLWIQNCKELSFTEEEGNENLKLSLRTLKIVKLPKLEVLPQWLQGSANTLQHLEIVNGHNFTTLPEWLLSLKSLQKLLILYCRKFSYLPEGMQDLTALRELRIKGCPNLRTKRKQDWPQIAHIPQVYLDADHRS
uniref:Uncharacterized protein n=1 Tax=Fagus sylvatica TaxID=28930 RepID=A0A2N9IH49_FAGSY